MIFIQLLKMRTAILYIDLNERVYMKLIVTDLDRTLLRNDKSISEYTVEILNRCREAGYYIAFATARAENGMVRFIDAIKPDAIISSGGAVISANGNVIYEKAMSVSDVKTIIRMCNEFTDGKGRLTAESVNGYFSNFVPDDPDRYNAFKYVDFTEFAFPCYKITAELERDEFGEIIARACDDCSVISYSGELWQRFASKTSTKEQALQTLARYYKINMSDVIAFGDDTNDIGMLKISGTSVAVFNAIQEVKDVADFITKSNDDDGVAEFLELIIL